MAQISVEISGLNGSVLSGNQHIYAWRGKNAPRLHSEPGTVQFELEYKKAIAERNRPKKNTFSSIIWDFEKSPEFNANLKERTKRDYTKVFEAFRRKIRRYDDGNVRY